MLIVVPNFFYFYKQCCFRCLLAVAVLPQKKLPAVIKSNKKISCFKICGS
jgi:hypothetical protein